MKVQMCKNEKALVAATTKAQNEQPNIQSGNSIMNNTTLSTENQNLSIFQFGEFSIRVVSINNEPWFIAKDICDTLGIKNPTQALENLDTDERAMFNIGLAQRANFDNRVSEINIVSESGMYTLILRCRDAVKKGSIPHRFRKWVTSEVLPQIRKTGKYEKTQTTVDDRTGLRNAVNMLVSKKGVLYSDAYNIVHQYMNVKSIEDIAKADLPKAIAYVHKLVLEGELIDTPTALLPKEDMVQVPRFIAEALVKYHRLTIRSAERAEKGLRAIHEAMGYERYHRNDLAAGLFDLHHEFNYWVDAFEHLTHPNTAPRLPCNI